jgi:hypothetical protein
MSDYNLAPYLIERGLKLCRACTVVDATGPFTPGCSTCNYSGREDLWRLVVTYPGAGIWHEIWLESGRPGSWVQAVEFRVMREQADDLIRQLAPLSAWVVEDRR